MLRSSRGLSAEMEEIFTTTPRPLGGGGGGGGEKMCHMEVYIRISTDELSWCVYTWGWRQVSK